MAIVAEAANGRVYLSPNTAHAKVAECEMPEIKPESEMNQDSSDLVSGRGYGFTYWYELFTNRQLTSLSTFVELLD